MFRVVEKEANFSVRVRKKNSLEVDHVRVLQLSKKLEGKKGNLNELQSSIRRTGSIQVHCLASWPHWPSAHQIDKLVEC